VLALVLIAAGPTLHASATTPPTTPPVVTNDLFPDNNDVTNCVGTVQQANCGSKARADGHTYLVFKVAYSPDSRQLVSGGVDRLNDSSLGVRGSRFEFSVCGIISPKKRFSVQGAECSFSVQGTKCLFNNSKRPEGSLPAVKMTQLPCL
jgi:hypothetical protein